MSKPDLIPKTCVSCGHLLGSSFWMCDEDMDGVWCEGCYPKTKCGKGKHGEGCPTHVFDDERSTPDE